MKNIDNLEKFRIADPISGELATDPNRGFFQFNYKDESYFVALNEIDGWEHLIIYSSKKTPSWKSASFFKSKFFQDNETVLEFFKDSKSRLKNVCELWHPTSSFELPNFYFFENRIKDIAQTCFANIDDEYYKITCCSAQGYDFVSIKGESRPSGNIIRRVKKKLLGDKITFQIHTPKTENGVTAYLFAPTKDYDKLPSVINASLNLEHNINEEDGLLKKA